MSVYLQSYSSNKQIERQTCHFDVIGSVKWKIAFLSAREIFGNSNRNFWLNGLRPPWHPQSRSSSLRSLLRRLEETSGSPKFRYRINFDWFRRQYKWLEENSKKFVGHSFEARHAQFNRKFGLKIRYF